MDVKLRRDLSDHEGGCDFPVRVSALYELQDLSFPWCERGEQLIPLRRTRLGDHRLEEALGKMSTRRLYGADHRRISPTRNHDGVEHHERERQLERPRSFFLRSATKCENGVAARHYCYGLGDRRVFLRLAKDTLGFGNPAGTGQCEATCSGILRMHS